MNQMATATVGPVGGKKGRTGARPETEGTMRSKLIFASCMMAVAVIGAAPAYAAPSGPAECTSPGGGPEMLPPATSYPGNSATSPGSIFNEPGTNSLNGGKGNQASPQKGSNSQYDRACARVTAANTNNPNSSAGTPYLVNPDPNAVITNNSRAARDALGVTHTGNGAKP